MRYFKSFFKHTWQPQQMDTAPGRLQGGGDAGAGSLGGLDPHRHCNARITSETELGELKASSVAASSPIGMGIACHNGACKPRPDHVLESPWHRLKSVFLVGMIVAFVVWLLVFVMLAKYELL